MIAEATAPALAGWAVFASGAALLLWLSRRHDRPPAPPLPSDQPMRVEQRPLGTLRVEGGALCWAPDAGGSETRLAVGGYPVDLGDALANETLDRLVVQAEPGGLRLTHLPRNLRAQPSGNLRAQPSGNLQESGETLQGGELLQQREVYHLSQLLVSGYRPSGQTLRLEFTAHEIGVHGNSGGLWVRARRGHTDLGEALSIPALHGLTVDHTPGMDGETLPLRLVHLPRHLRLRQGPTRLREGDALRGVCELELLGTGTGDMASL